MSAAVTGLSITPVKGMRVHAVDAVELTELGARGNRSFYVIDERGRMINGKRYGTLHTIVPDYDPDAGELTLRFPTGVTAGGRVRHGETLATRFHGHTYHSREVVGPWAEALSEFLGEPLRLVAAEIGVDRGREAAASVISSASLRHLAELGGAESVDPRRFRMLIEVDGITAHEEDDWIGRRVRVGSALLAMHGHVGRCMVTTRNPETGTVDFPTLKLLAEFRLDHPSAEPLPFGVYGEVLEGATVRVGDAVSLDGRV
ncbi:MAG TPA: MOSC N-terminal beta barrel domain-containing protein [Solirubrobacteraceae bacterium]